MKIILMGYYVLLDNKRVCYWHYNLCKNKTNLVCFKCHSNYCDKCFDNNLYNHTNKCIGCIEQEKNECINKKCEEINDIYIINKVKHSNFHKTHCKNSYYDKAKYGTKKCPVCHAMYCDKCGITNNGIIVWNKYIKHNSLCDECYEELIMFPNNKLGEYKRIDILQI
jgi:hypothetical protein